MKWPVYACLATGSVFGSSCDYYEESYFGNSCDCPCDYSRLEDSCFGEFGIEGNWLYMRPLVSSLEFARIGTLVDDTPEIINVERKCLKTKFDQGYEFYAFYRNATKTCTSWDIKGGILSHDFSGKTSVDTSNTPDGDFISKSIIPLMGFTLDIRDTAYLSAAGKLFTDLTELHAEIGWNYLPGCSWVFRAFAGLGYANLKQQIDVSYTEPIEMITTQNLQTERIIQQKSKFSGIGPRAGLYANWAFCGGVSLFGELTGNLFFASTSGTFSQSGYLAPESPLEERIFRSIESFCHNKRTIPSLDLRVGLTAKVLCFSCFTLSVQGGYRTIHYFDAFELFEIASSGLGSDNTQNNYFESPTSLKEENYALSGWFIGGSLGF